MLLGRNEKSSSLNDHSEVERKVIISKVKLVKMYLTVFQNIYNQIYSRCKLSHWILIIQKIVDDSILFSKSINNRQYILGLYLKIQQRAF